MKKKNLIAFLLTLCIVCNVLGVSLTQAWFVSGGNMGTGEFDTAKVSFLPEITPDEAQKQIYGTMIDGNTADNVVYLIPGEEIIKPFGADLPGMMSIENFSTVNTNVRMTVSCRFKDDAGAFVDMSNYSWSKTGENTYQYGVDVTLEGVSGEVHMGLIEIRLSNKTVGETTAPGYAAGADATPYYWQQITGADADIGDIYSRNSWELKLNSDNIIPAAAPSSRQMYNAVESIVIVGEHPEHQGEFNKFFSDTFAGNTVLIEVNYYAKQLMGMEWSMFTQSVFEAKV